MASEHGLLLQQQDAALDTLGQGVQRVKALAGVMRDELHEQSVILDSLDDDVEQADGAMHSMQKRMRSLMERTRSSERAHLGIIACLLVVLTILLMGILSD